MPNLWYQSLKRRFTNSEVAKGASYSLAVRVYGAALTFLFQLYLARLMGAEQLGIFVFAWSVLSTLTFLAPIGLETALVRFLAGYSGSKEWDNLRGILNLAFLSTVAISFAVMILGWAFLWAMRDFTQPYTVALAIAFAGVPAFALINLHDGIARGFRWIYQISMPIYVLRPTAFLLMILAGSTIGYAVDSTWAIIAMVLAGVLTWLFQYWRYRRSLSPNISKAKGNTNTRYWLLSSLPILVATSFEQLIANTDIMMLGMLEGPSATGLYNVALRIASIGHMFLFAISAIAAPKIADFYHQNRTEELVRFVSKVRLAAAIPTVVTGIGVIALGVPLLELFGEEFPSAYYPMILLCIAMGIRAMAGPIDYLLLMTGKQQIYARVLGGVALANLVANGLLIPLYGTIGAACATTASVFLELSLLSYLAGRHLGFRPWLLVSTMSR